MKHVVWIMALLVSCAPSKEEKAIADYEGLVDIDVLYLEKSRQVTAGDSIPILTKMMDSIAYDKMQNIMKRIRTLALAGPGELKSSALDEYQKRLDFYDKKVYDSTDLRRMNQRLKAYQAKPDIHLLDAYRCTYADGNKKITKTYYFKDERVVYAQ